jgi:hypothetical protein
MASIHSIRRGPLSLSIPNTDEAILLMGFYCSNRQLDMNQPNHYVGKAVKKETVKREKKDTAPSVKLSASQRNLLKQLGLIR